MKNRRKPRVDWTPETEAICTQAVLRYGTNKEALKHLDVSNRAYYNHLAKSPTFKKAVSRAKASHARLRAREIDDTKIRAFEVYEEALQSKKVVTVTEYEKALFDEKTGKPLNIIEKTKKTHTYTRRPDLKAAMRILGDDLDYFTMKSLTKDVELDAAIPLVNQILGVEYLKGWSVEDLELLSGVSLYSDRLEITKLRMIQAMITRQEEAGQISPTRAADYQLKIIKQTHTINNNIERKASQLMQGKTAQEWLQGFHQLVATIIKEMDKVARNRDIKREDITTVARDRLLSTEDGFQTSILTSDTV